jgi:hypothetical protein
MDSRNQNRIIAFCDRIRRLLADGLMVDQGVLRYLSSMGGGTTLSDLLYNPDNDSEYCSLVDLVFFPDTAFQIRMEPDLEEVFFDEDQVEVIKKDMADSPPEAKIWFPDSMPPVTIRMPEWSIHPFIDRLHIPFTLPSLLRNVIETDIPHSDQFRAKVIFRNHHPRLPESKTAFIRSFINGTDTQTDAFLPCLDFLLSIMDEFADDSDLMEGLRTKKWFYHKHLQDALRVKNQLEKANIETLLLGGARINPMHPEEAREKMRWIDQITLSVMGEIAWIGDEEKEVTFETTGLPRL